jgi:hypothetical protein
MINFSPPLEMNFGAFDDLYAKLGLPGEGHMARSDDGDCFWARGFTFTLGGGRIFTAVFPFIVEREPDGPICYFFSEGPEGNDWDEVRKKMEKLFE